MLYLSAVKASLINVINCSRQRWRLIGGHNDCESEVDHGNLRVAPDQDDLVAQPLLKYAFRTIQYTNYLGYDRSRQIESGIRFHNMRMLR